MAYNNGRTYIHSDYSMDHYDPLSKAPSYWLGAFQYSCRTIDEIYILILIP